jgi:hypothetical protein
MEILGLTEYFDDNVTNYSEYLSRRAGNVETNMLEGNETPSLKHHLCK